MVHTWIHVVNDRDPTGIGARHFQKALRNDRMSFYGDYSLSVYIGTRNDYDSLWGVAAKVIHNGDGWVRCNKMEEAAAEYAGIEYRALEDVLSTFANLSDSACKRLLPRKERDGGHILRTTVFRRDGNFYLIAVETQRLYYVFCFATS
jgi:hypothetical protein